MIPQYFIITKIGTDFVFIVMLVKITFVNCAGGDNLRILTLNIRLNEEFKIFEPGHYYASVDRSDGLWSYTYPTLKLKQGDKAYYWMNVTFGREMWFYVVKGYLDIICEFIL